MNSSARTDKVSLSIALGIGAIILFGTVVLLWDREHWLNQLVKALTPLATIAGIHYFCGRSRVLWIVGIIGIGLAVIFGDATAQAVQYSSGVVLGMLACALSASLGGFCLGCVAMRWLADSRR